MDEQVAGIWSTDAMPSPDEVERVRPHLHLAHMQGAAQTVIDGRVWIFTPIEPPDPMTEAKRQEWLDDEDRHATWQGVEVEVS